MSESEIASLFRLLSDDMLLHDPSRGTCCRNRCSGCAYLDLTSGDFACDEYTAAGGGADDPRPGGWLAPYVFADFGDRVHASLWGRILFSGTTDAANEDGDPEVASPPPPRGRELGRDRFASLILAAESKVGVEGVSPLALHLLWDVLSPAVGYPRLSSNEIMRAIRGMEGSSYKKGGVANFEAFKRGMIGAAERIVWPGVGARHGGNAGGGAATTASDYNLMDKDKLLAECASRGMTTSFPKMKRIIIEELRFYNAHGKQGKRHPVKNTLS